MTEEQKEAILELIKATSQAAGDLPNTYEYEETSSRANKAIIKVKQLLKLD